MLCANREGAVVESVAAYRLHRSEAAGSSEEAAGRAELAATQEAQRNAEQGDTAGYQMRTAGASWHTADGNASTSPVVARVLLASSALLPKASLRDLRNR